VKASMKNLWAPIATPKRGAPWPLFHCIRESRKAARDAYLEGVPESMRPSALERVRFAKLTITEQ
jgi:hypothetical protein